ncbi:MAG: hypothetical protein COA78_02115 [Blastopirellula sp.]|nr:MAG: hypothetical protein COA78_02115 [Blastopirellula sp.]
MFEEQFTIERPSHALGPMVTKMALKGATRGMIIQKLRSERLDEITAETLADNAFRAVAIRKRIKGIGIMLMGLMIIGAGLYSTIDIRVDSSIKIIFCGVIVLGLGLAMLLHRTRLT